MKHPRERHTTAISFAWQTLQALQVRQVHCGNTAPYKWFVYELKIDGGNLAYHWYYVDI